MTLHRHTPTSDEHSASLRVDPSERTDHTIPPELYAKFAEHLGWNIYHGMDAQILFNPTFGEWRFPAGSANAPDGGQRFAHDPDEVAAQIEEFAAMHDLPSPEPLAAAYEDAGAFWWQRHGDEDAVQFSPDTGPTGDRAQRVEISPSDDSAGIRQWVYLPLQRTDGYELALKGRATAEADVTVALHTTTDEGDPDTVLAETTLPLDSGWTTHEADLTVGATGASDVDGDGDPSDVDADALGEDDLYAVTVTTTEPANLVLDRLTLYPDDHVNRADPDVVEFLQEAELPLLRWPGGNFVSGYDWTDGIGPVDERPTKPNPAWGGLEYNLFGTAEFVEFCEAVGCEPMICVNAGDGTPEEAARWVEYCNGDPEETEMGALRAEHGYEEPFDITYWELGNELWGPWQINWTTPAGNADRYQRFREAVLDVDPDVKVQACGHRFLHDEEWNDVLLEEAGETVRCITDHILAGGPVSTETDADELFHAFMGFADQLGDEFRALRDDMLDAGVANPRLAITELQLFAGWSHDDTHLPAAWRFSRGMPPEVGLPNKKTISEPLYDATIIHECIRMGEFPEMVTHSATVNHGGGLQKQKERVWGDPAHYGHVLGVKLGGCTPVGVDVECATISTDESFGQIDPVDDVPAIDALAAVDDDADELVVMLVHRASTDPIEVSLEVDGAAGTTAERVDLTASTMAAENTLEDPENVVPEESTVELSDGTAEFTISPYSLTRLTVPLTD